MTDPNVGLDVFHDVSEMEISIGVRQCRRQEDSAISHDFSRMLLKRNNFSGSGTRKQELRSI